MSEKQEQGLPPEPVNLATDIIWQEVLRLRAQVNALACELERERMRLAACGVAAHGGETEPILPEYESDALTATRALNATLARVEALLVEMSERWHTDSDINDVITAIEAALRGPT